MSLIPLIILGSAVMCIVIGTFVLLHSRKQSINHAFFVFSLGAALWIGMYGLIVGLQNDVFLPLLNIGGLILVAGLTRFAQVFPTYTRIPINPLLFWLPLGIGGTAMIITNTIILNVEVLPSGVAEITHGPLIGLWSLLLLAYILVSVTLFILSYRQASFEDRTRLRIVYVGTSLFVFTAIIFDAILPGVFGYVRLNQIGPLASLFFILTTAYAIMRYQFMDIRVVIQRSIVYSLSFFMLTIVYVALLVSTDKLFEGMGNFYAPLSAGITIFIGIYSLPYMEAYFQKITDPWFFKRRYDYFAVLESFSVVLNTNLNMRPLALESLTILEDTFRPKYSYFIRSQTRTCYSHTDCSHASVTPDTDEKGIRIPIFSDRKMIGEYILGPKRSGDAYSKMDLSLMRALAGHATAAFEKAELYQKLREYSDQLEEKVSERTKHLTDLQVQQREFFDDISHALQTPLTILKSSFDCLHKKTSSDDLRRYVEMESSITNLSHLIRSILKLARIETYSPETEMRTVNFTDTVLHITEYVRTIAESEGVSLSVVLPDPNVNVRGNQEQLAEACTNLLSNAVKYTAHSKIKFIYVSLVKYEEEAILTVKDTGIGMAPDQLVKIFERYYRAEQSGKTKEGYGLGLAITKRIVERHNGTLRFASAPGNGTTAILSLPVEVPEALPE